jgi:hypothetical protein
MMDYEKMPETQFSVRMREAAARIYEKVYPGCRVEYLERGHVLDKTYGIDCRIHTGNQYFTLQEKYRKNEFLYTYFDFTQKYQSATGTIWQGDGEWFNLAAQIYFYGWTNPEETEFEKWFIMDIGQYKKLVNDWGGLDEIGYAVNPKRPGAANFYGIHPSRLMPAWVSDYRLFLPKKGSGQGNLKKTYPETCPQEEGSADSISITENK